MRTEASWREAKMEGISKERVFHEMVERNLATALHGGNVIARITQ